MSEPKFTIIPAGYRITVDSWENDADNDRTETVSGLSLDTVRFYRDVCDLMGDGFGNMYDPEPEEIDKLREAFVKVAERHKDTCEIAAAVMESAGNDNENDDPLNQFGDIHGDLFGYGSDGFYTRVLSGLRIEHVEADIRIRDVTEEI